MSGILYWLKCNKLSFGIACALFAVVLWFLAPFRNWALAENAHAIGYVLTKASIAWTAETPAVAVGRWVLLAVEVPLAVTVATLIIRTLGRSMFGWASATALSEILRVASMFLAAGCNIAMAFYAYSVLWGEASFQGFVIFKVYDPAILHFSDGVWIGLVGALYALSQGIPFLFHPGSGVGWQMTSITTSLPMIGIIGWTWLVYRFGDYDWTSFRIAALQVWGVIELLDVINIAVIFWLAKRTIVAASSTEDTRHEH